MLAIIDFFKKINLIRFYKYLLIYTLLVILWGAWVRISHSGDGCGASWPLCHGQILPKGADSKTWTELIHRLMSGFYGIIVVLGYFISKSKKNSARPHFWIKATVFFMVTEALLGAKLVLFGLVGTNDSLYRSFSMALHFINSMLLVMCTCTAYLYLRYPPQSKSLESRFQVNLVKIFKQLKWSGWGSLFIIGVTGTVAALANTLFPSSSLLEGLKQDFNPDSHFLIQWRIVHPLLGAAGGLLFGLSFYFIQNLIPKDEKPLLNTSKALTFLFFMTPLIGLIIILTNSILFFKIFHLICVYLLWIYLIQFFYFFKFKTQR